MRLRNGVATNNVETALGRPNAESRSMGRETQSGRYWKRNREETFRYVGGKDMTGASVRVMFWTSGSGVIPRTLSAYSRPR
ncbi:hypothetical protein HBI56_129040 [Parastagonospora nodorum]|nr:hypothetical protein HBH50_187580 [Parastagonospora nodorum]KAH4079646.1 hypothetical protein HBH48_216640 [Parastagonospora nodorum]KAH4256862.1 hypothetical protein HBI03_158000 [Parastagonospora nodorum]KAH4269917.1 hypothetical protein HBI04_153000 [Parastagonospora nodorum]KAH4404808.1 hypothetical protein HBH92_188470 [Parastagonospora nodorum]